MKKIILSILFISACLIASAQLKVQSLTTETLTNPLSIDNLHPAFSWQLSSTQNAVLQTAYQIRVSEGKHEVWNTGKVASDQSLYVIYNGKALKSGQKYSWQVKVWDNYGHNSGWS